MQALAQAGLTPVATLDRTEALARWALQLSGADGSWAPAMAELVALQAVALGPTEGPGPLASQRAFARALADSPVALATAGRVLGRPRIVELRAALGGKAGQAWLAHRWSARLSGLPDGGLRDALDRGHAFACGALRFTALAALGLPASPWSNGARGPCRDAIAHALGFLADHPGVPGSWDAQRWGLAPDPTPLLSRTYAHATVLLARAEADDPAATDQLRRLLGDLPDGPARYFGSWDGIPPDSDSLGLLLLAAQAVGGVPAARVRSWTRPLAASADPDGTIPTWLDDGGAAPSERWEWMGRGCTASRTMLLLGLLAEGEDHGVDVDRNVESIVSAWESGRSGSHFYREDWALVLLLRLRHRLTAAGRGARVLPRLDAILAHAAQDAAATQHRDGGWGDPLRSANLLRVLAWRSSASVAVARGIRYLCEAQRPNGSWPSAPYFLTIGKPPYRDHWHGGVELTTALCLSALRDVQGTLPDEPHGHH